MKTKLLLVALLAPCMLMAQNGKFSIEGKTGKKAPSKIYLVSIQGKQLASETTPKKGAFSFKGDIPGMTTALMIFDYDNRGLPTNSLAGYDFLVFMLGEESIKIATADSIKNGNITNSPINDDNKTLMDAINPIRKKEKTVAKTALYPEYEAAAKTFIASHPQSPVSIVAFEYLMRGDWDAKAVLSIFNTLDAKVRDSKNGQDLAARIDAEIKTGVGVEAPNFTQNDVNDKPISLSDFRGKWVLIDFWASWCGPCRGENPHVVAAYNEFKDKGFTVLGVSLDKPGKKADWLAAIEKDGLTWPQVSDLKGWGNEAAAMYGVRGIPANFLIDPQGKIVAKNLRGDALKAKLAEVLK